MGVGSGMIFCGGAGGSSIGERLVGSGLVLGIISGAGLGSFGVCLIGGIGEEGSSASKVSLGETDLRSSSVCDFWSLANSLRTTLISVGKLSTTLPGFGEFIEDAFDLCLLSCVCKLPHQSSSRHIDAGNNSRPV